MLELLERQSVMAETLSWFAALAGILGSFYIARQKRVGFAIWIITNLFWISFNLWHGHYGQMAMFIAYLVLPPMDG